MVSKSICGVIHVDYLASVIGLRVKACASSMGTIESMLLAVSVVGPKDSNSAKTHGHGGVP